VTEKKEENQTAGNEEDLEPVGYSGGRSSYHVGNAGRPGENQVGKTAIRKEGSAAKKHRYPRPS